MDFWPCSMEHESAGGNDLTTLQAMNMAFRPCSLEHDIQVVVT